MINKGKLRIMVGCEMQYVTVGASRSPVNSSIPLQKTYLFAWRSNEILNVVQISHSPL